MPSEADQRGGGEDTDNLVVHHGATPELIGTVESEAQRLNRFVANLLVIARVIVRDPSTERRLTMSTKVFVVDDGAAIRRLLRSRLRAKI